MYVIMHLIRIRIICNNQFEIYTMKTTICYYYMYVWVEWKVAHIT